MYKEAENLRLKGVSTQKTLKRHKSYKNKQVELCNDQVRSLPSGWSNNKIKGLKSMICKF